MDYMDYKDASVASARCLELAVEHRTGYRAVCEWVPEFDCWSLTLDYGGHTGPSIMLHSPRPILYRPDLMRMYCEALRGSA